MSENNQQAPIDSKAKLRLEDLKEEGKRLTEQEMKQVAGGVGPNRINFLGSSQQGISQGRTIYYS
ncbi:hypothetical protein [Paenibacillus paeoniae]|uniref:Bacteriocin n=1 Tax=Paenibacillus paeoniae TaxID=2292705 RepID=A0A371PN41_9BACL|nr:hypothetical protein [Paenibacillus paeoniae]REK77598.1 hypothetical protein DX130_11565 [Paenibacillus paeoniae]